MERMLDLAAQELGMDPVEIRRKNMILAEAFPHEQGIIGQDFIPLIYDSGDYPATLEKARAMIGYDKFIKEEQPRLRAEGKHVGIGVACFTEAPRRAIRGRAGHGRVQRQSYPGDGRWHARAGALYLVRSNRGRSVGVDVRDVRVVTGDTAQFHWGTGTFASRGITVAGNAVNAAAANVRTKILKHAARPWARRKRNSR